MRILVLGATGSIGTAVAAELKRAGHQVVGLARSAESGERLTAQGYAVLEGDLRAPEAWSDAVTEVDGLVQVAATFTEDMGAVDRGVIEAIARSAGGRSTPLRLVYTGGCWLYGATGDLVATEETPFNPIAPFAWMLDNAAFLAEASSLNLVILHPAMVYHREGGVFSRFLDPMQAGEAVEVWGHRKVRWPLIHRDDLASAYRLLVERSNLTGHFNASAEEGVTVGEVVDALIARFGGPCCVIERPLEEVVAEQGDWAEGPTLDQQMGSQKLRRITGWTPKVSDYRLSDLFD